MKSASRVVRHPLSLHANKCAHSHAPLRQLFNKSRWIAQFHIFIERGSLHRLYDMNVTGISVHKTPHGRISSLCERKKYYETETNLNLNVIYANWNYGLVQRIRC